MENILRGGCVDLQYLRRGLCCNNILGGHCVDQKTSWEVAVLTNNTSEGGCVDWKTSQVTVTYAYNVTSTGWLAMGASD